MAEFQRKPIPLVAMPADFRAFSPVLAQLFQRFWMSLEVGFHDHALCFRTATQRTMSELKQVFTQGFVRYAKFMARLVYRRTFARDVCLNGFFYVAHAICLTLEHIFTKLNGLFSLSTLYYQILDDGPQKAQHVACALYSNRPRHLMPWVRPSSSVKPVLYVIGLEEFADHREDLFLRFALGKRKRILAHFALLMYAALPIKKAGYVIPIHSLRISK